MCSMNTITLNQNYNLCQGCDITRQEVKPVERKSADMQSTTSKRRPMDAPSKFS